MRIKSVGVSSFLTVRYPISLSLLSDAPAQAVDKLRSYQVDLTR
jgi:hypothetical protein